MSSNNDPDALIKVMQMQKANLLVSEAETYAPLIALIGEMPPGFATRLRDAHETLGYLCSARSEGLACCLDILLADPADYAPETVQAAAELLARYRESRRS